LGKRKRLDRTVILRLEHLHRLLPKVKTKYPFPLIVKWFLEIIVKYTTLSP
jgi:hypothetical protein